MEHLLKKKSKADPLFSEDGGCEKPPAEHLSSPAIEYIFLLLYFYLTDLDTFTIVPVKMDMRAEYCPSALMVNGCLVELSQGALEFFDDDASRYVLALSLIS